MLGQRRSALLALPGLGLVAVPAPAALQLGSLHGLPLSGWVFYHCVYCLAMPDSRCGRQVLDLREDVEHEGYAEDNEGGHDQGAGAEALTWLRGCLVTKRGRRDDFAGDELGVAEATAGAEAEGGLDCGTAPRAGGHQARSALLAQLGLLLVLEAAPLAACRRCDGPPSRACAELTDLPAQRDSLAAMGTVPAKGCAAVGAELALRSVGGATLWADGALGDGLRAPGLFLGAAGHGLRLTY
jgi:hypothetical protein